MLPLQAAAKTIEQITSMSSGAVATSLARPVAVPALRHATAASNASARSNASHGKAIRGFMRGGCHLRGATREFAVVVTITVKAPGLVGLAVTIGLDRLHAAFGGAPVQLRVTVIGAALGALSSPICRL